MERSTQNAVLRRKANAAKENWQARAMSPAKALRLSLARAADHLWDLALAASGIALSEEPQEAVIDALPEGGLIVLLDGPDGAIGAACFQYPVVAGLVEVQTMGRVSPAAPEPRRVTRTDAAMVAPLLDEAFERFDALMEEAGGADWALGYRFGTMMDSPRMLSLALKATDFHVFRLTLDLAARREGEAMLIIPVRDPDVTGADIGEGDLRQQLEAQVLVAPAELRAILHRVRMPLSDIGALKVGDVIPVPRKALGQTSLEVVPQSGLVTGRLGQMNGMRAVRLVLSSEIEEQGECGARPASEKAVTELVSQPAPPQPGPPDQAHSEPPADDLLGDLPDLGDLPGLGDYADGTETRDLPDLGPMPMALPEIE